MSQMHTCAVRGLGYGHKWENDVIAPPDWKPNTQKFNVYARRYDICDEDRGGCGMYRCVLIGARQYTMTYWDATRVKYDVRPDVWQVHEMVEELKRQARADRRKERTGPKARKLRAA